jgi:hypothetical protein
MMRYSEQYTKGLIVANEALAKQNKELLAENATIQVEAERLRAWKHSQLAVESKWDIQAVSKALNIPLGKCIRTEALPAIEGLNAAVKRLEAFRVAAIELHPSLANDWARLNP